MSHSSTLSLVLDEGSLAWCDVIVQMTAHMVLGQIEKGKWETLAT